MTELTEHHRKVLTEYLEECWHEWRYIRGPVKQERWECLKCGEYCIAKASEEQVNRTFTTPADLHAVYSKMVEKGEWEEFYARMTGKFIVAKQNCYLPHCQLAAWLSCYSCESEIPIRMVMAAEFIKEKP